MTMTPKYGCGIAGFKETEPDEKSKTLQELVATEAHNIWCIWINYMMSDAKFNPDGSLTIPAKTIDRWNRQIKTNYKDLPEDEKKSDIEIADKYIELIKPKWKPMNVFPEKIKGEFSDFVIIKSDTYKWIAAYNFTEKSWVSMNDQYMKVTILINEQTAYSRNFQWTETPK